MYYEIQQAIQQNKVRDTALVRLEQFYAFPEGPLRQFIDANRTVKDWRWVQEEPRNMGAYTFVRARLEKLTGTPLTFVSRPDASSPATGVVNIFRRQQADIINQAIAVKTTKQKQVK